MKYCLSIIALVCAFATTVPQSASAQGDILSEIYGRGVHAYYAGRYDEAEQLFSSAIDNGSKDPRVFYFRGIVNMQRGSSLEAESDWQQGAQIEARGTSVGSIGRSLSRFQGAGRLQLEQIRQTAKLQALMTAAARSDIRMNEIRGTRNGAAASSAASAATPPPTPPAAENPFKDDSPNMATGDAKVQADDALKGTLDPLPDTGIADAGAADTAAGDAGMFGEAADAPAGGDPFGGGDTTSDADPFGGGDMADPFGGGGDPFGN